MTKLAIGRQEDPALAGFFFAPKCHESSIIIDVRYWRFGLPLDLLNI